MNEDFTDLENELERLRPRSLPAPLMGRIAAELGGQAHRRGLLASWRSWILPAAGSAMLAVIVASMPFLTRDKEAATVAAPIPPALANAPGPSESKMLPVHATNVLYDTANEGIVYLDDQTPARRIRLSYFDTITWENPPGGASLKWTVPREEIYFFPVLPH